MDRLFNGIQITGVHCYSRVSTLTQTEQGISLDEQKNKQSKFLADNNLNAISYYIDGGYSGSKTYEQRPELLKLMTIIKKNELLLVCSLDRLARNVADLLNICQKAKDRGFYIYFMNMNMLYPSHLFGDMLITMVGAVSSMERQLIQERSKNTWKYRKEMGLKVKDPWFMRVADSDVENLKREQIRDIVSNCYNDGFSYDWIADYLNKMKYKTVNNRDFYANSVKQIVDYFISTGKLKKRNIRDIIKTV
jgi:DNA invertase Pin-like site-specific DNA recombinase